MTRPAPWRLDPAAYPHADTIETRFQDLDILGHINNVAWAALFETARLRFLEHVTGSLPNRGRGLAAKSEINYLAEGHYPGPVAMHHGIGAIGRRSWQVCGLALQDGIAVATCDVTLVSPAETDPAFRALLEPWTVLRPPQG